MKVMLIDTKEDPVRLAFLHVFTKRPGMKNADGTQSPDKFEATPILVPGGANAKKVQAAIAEVAADKWGANWADDYAEFADDQKGLRKGNLKKTADGTIYDGFEGQVYVTAKNDVRPGLFDTDATPLAQEDGKPYSGCYGNVEIDVWALAKRGVKKRIVMDLLGIQFTRDGDAFSAGAAPSKADSFAALSAAKEDGGSKKGSVFDD